MHKSAFLLLLLLLPLWASDTLFLAFNDFEARSGIESGAIKTIGEKISSEMAERDVFRIMSRSEMQGILKEMEFQMSGMCSDDACLVEAGQILGVEYIATGAVSKIDDLYSLSLKMINVGTSEVEYSHHEEFRCSLSDLLESKVKTYVHNLEEKVLRKKYGRFTLLSEPGAATVIINKDSVGITPFTSSYLPAGAYSFELNLDTYTPITGTAKIEAGQTLELNTFKMDRSQVYLDSLASIDKRKSRRRQIVRRIIFGTVAAATAGTGLLFNDKVTTASNKQAEYEIQYDNATSGFDEIRENIESQREDAQNAATIRNVLYGVGGGATLGFCISIPL